MSIEQTVLHNISNIQNFNVKPFPHNFFRCKIPECDLNIDNRKLEYHQPWLEFAIPMKNDTYENCYRYAPINTTLFGSGEQNQCNSNQFDPTKTIKCAEYVYASDEINLQTEVNEHF